MRACVRARVCLSANGFSFALSSCRSWRHWTETGTAANTNWDTNWNKPLTWCLAAADGAGGEEEKRREGRREWMKRERGLAGRLWATDRHWNVHSLWWEEERLNTLDNQHSSNHSTRTPDISPDQNLHSRTPPLSSPRSVSSLAVSVILHLKS